MNYKGATSLPFHFSMDLWIKVIFYEIFIYKRRISLGPESRNAPIHQAQICRKLTKQNKTNQLIVYDRVQMHCRFSLQNNTEVLVMGIYTLIGLLIKVSVNWAFEVISTVQLAWISSDYFESFYSPQERR